MEPSTLLIAASLVGQKAVSSPPNWVQVGTLLIAAIALVASVMSYFLTARFARETGRQAWRRDTLTSTYMVLQQALGELVSCAGADVIAVLRDAHYSGAADVYRRLDDRWGSVLVAVTRMTLVWEKPTAVECGALIGEYAWIAGRLLPDTSAGVTRRALDLRQEAFKRLLDRHERVLASMRFDLSDHSRRSRKSYAEQLGHADLTPLPEDSRSLAELWDALRQFNAMRPDRGTDHYRLPGDGVDFLRLAGFANLPSPILGLLVKPPTLPPIVATRAGIDETTELEITREIVEIVEDSMHGVRQHRILPSDNSKVWVWGPGGDDGISHA